MVGNPKQKEANIFDCIIPWTYISILHPVYMYVCLYRQIRSELYRKLHWFILQNKLFHSSQHNGPIAARNQEEFYAAVRLNTRLWIFLMAYWNVSFITLLWVNHHYHLCNMFCWWESICYIPLYRNFSIKVVNMNWNFIVVICKQVSETWQVSSKCHKRMFENSLKLKLLNQ